MIAFGVFIGGKHMQQKKNTISLVCLICHFLVTIIATSSNYIAAVGFIDIGGAIASTIGLSVLVIATYLLLYFEIIGKIGAIIGFSLQVISSVGQQISHYAIAENDNYIVLGIASGIGLNLFFAGSIYLLSNTKSISHKDANSLNEHCVHFQNDECTGRMKELKERRGHYDFSSEEGEANRQLRKLMNIPEQECIIRMGEIKAKGISLLYVLMAGMFYVAFIVLSILTKGKHYSGIFSPIEYRILGIEVANKYAFEKEYTFTIGLGIYIFICVVVTIIPVAFYMYQRWKISTTKFLLTEKKVYVFDSRESVPKAIIPLYKIKSVDLKSNFYINSAQNIIITNIANERVNINGVRNANAFLNAVIEEYRKNGG